MWENVRQASCLLLRQVTVLQPDAKLIKFLTTLCIWWARQIMSITKNKAEREIAKMALILLNISNLKLHSVALNSSALSAISDENPSTYARVWFLIMPHGSRNPCGFATNYTNSATGTLNKWPIPQYASSGIQNWAGREQSILRERTH